MQHDMVLKDAGYFCESSGEDGTPQGRLPMKKALRPFGLSDTAKLDELQKLAKVDFSLCGHWYPPDGEHGQVMVSPEETLRNPLLPQALPPSCQSYN